MKNNKKVKSVVMFHIDSLILPQDKLDEINKLTRERFAELRLKQCQVQKSKRKNTKKKVVSKK